LYKYLSRSYTKVVINCPPLILRGIAMYSSVNFKTKKEFKEAVAKGEKIRLFAPGLGVPVRNG